ncbi:MAG: hypothetical protein WC091_02565 [Sulfuricellaceae bacterium]
MKNKIITRSLIALYDTIGNMRRKRWEKSQPARHRRSYGTMSMAESRANRGL